MKALFASKILMVLGRILLFAPVIFLSAAGYLAGEPPVRRWLGLDELPIANAAIVLTLAGAVPLVLGLLLYSTGSYWRSRIEPYAWPPDDAERTSLLGPYLLTAIGIVLIGLPLANTIGLGMLVKSTDGRSILQLDISGILEAAQSGQLRYGALAVGLGLCWYWIIRRRETAGYVFVPRDFFNPIERRWLGKVCWTTGVMFVLSPFVLLPAGFLIDILRDSLALTDDVAQRMDDWLRFAGLTLLLPGMVLVSRSESIMHGPSILESNRQCSAPAFPKVASALGGLFLGFGIMMLIGPGMVLITEFLFALNGAENIPVNRHSPLAEVPPRFWRSTYYLFVLGAAFRWISRRHDRVGYILFPPTANIYLGRLRMAKGVMVALGLLTLVFGALGIMYTLPIVISVLIDHSDMESTPFFFPIYLFFSMLMSVCYLILLVCGVQFVRLKTRMIRVFIGVLVTEVVAFIGIAMLWGVPSVGMAAAGATGISMGGLATQWATLYPMWAPIAVLWARDVLNTLPSDRNENGGSQASPLVPTS
ncbi:MAG: hypothetical protein AMXMBFR84_38870 [Candidatus Hydrogenedentota bacterium]